MNDINLSSSDLRLVRLNEQGASKSPVSPQGQGGSANVSLLSAASDPDSPVDAAQQERLREGRETQREELSSAVSRLNEFVQTVQRDLQFEVNNESGKTVVRVIDQKTEEVIRQIPDDVALRLAEKLQQDEPLTLFNIEV